jgi:hypothetical protein
MDSAGDVRRVDAPAVPALAGEAAEVVIIAGTVHAGGDSLQNKGSDGDDVRFVEARQRRVRPTGGDFSVVVQQFDEGSTARDDPGVGRDAKASAVAQADDSDTGELGRRAADHPVVRGVVDNQNLGIGWRVKRNGRKTTSEQIRP